jgi:hypothetical protein
MLFAEGFTFRNFLIDVFGIGVLVPSKVTSKSHLRVIAAFLKSRDQRKRVEMRFAHLKIHHGFERMRLRGPYDYHRPRLCAMMSIYERLPSGRLAARKRSPLGVAGRSLPR